MVLLPFDVHTLQVQGRNTVKPPAFWALNRSSSSSAALRRKSGMAAPLKLKGVFKVKSI